ncbi:hypothetical protein [Brevundimonas sp.]|uniref:hypothetical protein n=1 Tax=Brevundimonas sp. TaxID=1871086 RepID=UPI0028B057CD|nr:hypothetical protein [Brevundimonas sp.]
MSASVERSTAIVKAIRALGAPYAAARVAVLGNSALRQIVEAILKPSEISTDLQPSLEAATFDLILMVDYAETGRVSDSAERLQAAHLCLKPDGVVAVALSTLGAPISSEGAGPYDQLLFPEAGAAGKLGAEAALATPLAMSTWILLAASLGFELIESAGIGEHEAPDWLHRGHAPRLALFDAGELRTGQMVLLLKRKKEPA